MQELCTGVVCRGSMQELDEGVCVQGLHAVHVCRSVCRSSMQGMCAGGGG